MNSQPDKNLPLRSCPYKGQPMELVFDDSLKHSGWYYKGGLDLKVPFLSEAEALKAVRMRNGSLCANVKNFVCLYTGVPLSIVERNGLWFVDGEAYSPSIRHNTKTEAAYAAGFKKGEAPTDMVLNVPKITSLEVNEPHSDPSAGLGGDPDGVLEEKMQSILEE